MTDDVTQKVIEAADSASGQAQAPGEVRLSTGVVVRVRPVPKTAFLALRRKFKEPQVPIEMNADKGRQEENPSNPDYLRALAEYRTQMGTAAINIMLLLGTEVVSVPEGVPGAQDAVWLEERELLGIASGEGARAMYLDWLMYKAGPLDSDLNALALAVGRKTGTAEADVAEAVKSVRGGA